MLPSLRSRVRACTGWYCGENKPAPRNSLLDWPAWEITGLTMSYVICMCHFRRTQSISRDVMLKAGTLKVQCAGFWGNYWDKKCMKVYDHLNIWIIVFLLCRNEPFIHRVVTGNASSSFFKHFFYEVCTSLDVVPPCFNSPNTGSREELSSQHRGSRGEGYSVGCWSAASQLDDTKSDTLDLLKGLNTRFFVSSCYSTDTRFIHISY